MQFDGHKNENIRIPTRMSVAAASAPTVAVAAASAPTVAIAAASAPTVAVAAASAPTTVDLSSGEDLPLGLMDLAANDADSMRTIIEWLGGGDLCSCACVCKELIVFAHDDSLWLPIASRLPSKWAYTERERAAEAPWVYTLRIRYGLYSASVWKKLDDHRNGSCPYLSELGVVTNGTFYPDRSRMNYASAALKYGSICELVQLEAAREGGVSHRTYKRVAEQIVAMSADAKSAVPDDIHMIIREIYKSCYAGFGTASGSSSCGMGFGEPGTLAQVIARKGVARRVSRESMGTGASSPRSPAGRSPGGKGCSASSPGKVSPPGSGGSSARAADDEMRKRLETQHRFVGLVRS